MPPMEIERKFTVKALPENLDSLQNIDAFLKRKLSAAR